MPLPVGIVAVYLLLAIAFHGEAWASARSAWAGYPGDPVLFMWWMRWLPHALAHWHNPLYTTYLNYPRGVNGMWSTSVVLPSFLLAPVTLMLGPIVAYNVALTLALAGSGASAYLAIHRFVPNHLAAFLGGLMYEFSPYLLPQSVGHLNLTFAFAPPLALILLDEIAVRQSWPTRRAGMLFGLVAAAQLLTSEEIFASGVIVALTGLGVLAIMNRAEVRSRLRYCTRALAWAAIVFVPVVAFPVWMQFLGAGRVHGLIQVNDQFVTDLLGFITPTAQRYDPGGLGGLAAHFTGNGSEWNGYLGIPLICILAFATVRFRRRRLILWSAAMMAITSVLSLGPHLHVGGRITRIPLPWRVFNALPVVGNILPNRLTLYTDLFALILLAFVLHRLMHTRSPAAWVGGSTGIALVILTWIPTLPAHVTHVSVPGFFTAPSVAAIPANSTALLLPFTVDESNDAPMLWQAEAGMRFAVPSGYFVAPDDRGNVRHGPEITTAAGMLVQLQTGILPALPDQSLPDLRRVFDDQLRTWRVSTVAIGPMPRQQAMTTAITRLLERPPEVIDGVSVWRL